MNPETTREKILKAAIEVIAEKGYESASLREIAQRAGVSKSLVIWYFNGKKGLIRRVAEKALPSDVAKTCLKEGNMGEKLIDCIIEKFLNKYNDDKMKRLLIHSLSLSLEDRDIGEELQKLCRKTLSEIAKSGYGESTPITRSLVRFLFGALLCHALNPIDEEDLGNYIHTLRLLVSPSMLNNITSSFKEKNSTKQV